MIQPERERETAGRNGWIYLNMNLKRMCLTYNTSKYDESFFSIY
jgi:hypothetical protein